ncbi:hypothetical protein ACWEVY_28705 [Streptomyces longwoodensis]
MKKFLSKNAVRLVGLLGALAPVLVARYPDVPWEALVGCVAALLGLGEVAQRKHDAKTAAAWAVAEAGHLAIQEIERLKEKQPDAAAAPTEGPDVQFHFD